MCGRASLTVNEAELEERFDSDFYSEDLERYNPIPNYNIAPTHFLPLLIDKHPGQFQIYRWGLIPFWSKDIKIASKMINTRVETILEKPYFKTAVQSRRCIVPLDGFYEWQKTESGEKHPLRIQVKSEKIFATAGIYDSWRSPDGSLLNSFSILTCPSNELMKPIHDRMPVILSRQAEKWWLSPENTWNDLLGLMVPYESDDMKAYRVKELVNQVKNNSAELLEPYESNN